MCFKSQEKFKEIKRNNWQKLEQKSLKKCVVYE